MGNFLWELLPLTIGFPVSLVTFLGISRVGGHFNGCVPSCSSDFASLFACVGSAGQDTVWHLHVDVCCLVFVMDGCVLLFFLLHLVLNYMASMKRCLHESWKVSRVDGDRLVPFPSIESFFSRVPWRPGGVDVASSPSTFLLPQM